jgi:hypothetical protein
MVRLAKSLAGKSQKDADEALQRQHLDATERLSVKLEINAQAAQRELSASLATDSAEWHPAERPMQPLTEIERLMQRVSMKPGMQYSEADIDEGCRIAGITSPTEKLAIKLEAEERKMLRKRSQLSQNSRRLFGQSIQASTERPRGNRLTDASGQPVTLRSRP